MDWANILSAIGEHIIIPIIIALGTAILLVLKTSFDKIAKSVVAKNELSDMEKKTNIRKELIATIAVEVEAAVGSNMQLADKMKESGQKLTDEQIKSLNNSAKQLVINALPPSLTEENGVLLEIIGGKDRLEAIIDAMMEKSVYEYKVKKAKAQEYVRIEQVPQSKSKTKQTAPTRPIK